MTWTLNAAEIAFRDGVRDFLARELPPELRAAGRRCAGIFTDHGDGIRWHRILAKRGWSTPHWPVEHGGTGWTPMQHYLFASELAAADAPPLAPMGTGMVAPVIIAFGTHPKWQERPLLIVVKRAGAQVTGEELLEFLARRVAKWWLPDDVAFVDSLPHTATGKLLKTRLREQFKGYVAAKAS